MMMRGLKVWLPALRAGSGIDVFAMRLAEGLRKAGHQPVLQWFEHAYEWKPWLLRGVSAPPGTDLVHAASWQGFAFKRPGLPLVVTEHQYIRHPRFLPHRRPLQTIYHRLFVDLCIERSYRAADALVAVSEHTAQAIRHDVRQPVDMIHNWVDTETFSPGPPRRRDPSAPLRLLFVGNPSRWKGADVLADLAKRLGPGFEIHCLEGLRKSFDTRDWPANMHVLARKTPDGMAAIYRSMDVALVPTRYEAFGYVAVEAMACGLPVVGFDSTGTAEVCVHGSTALLAPMDDVATLADHARQLAADPALAERLGQAGRRRAVEYFGEARAVAAYEMLYRRVLNAGARHG
ncbi:glycosyltransferase family 4 protein [Dyella sp.]|uniref:glycosyltransferase family 4 protein n=1 Tax=Dyella sp. TaxID=1869338 RepID=UPI002ED2E264